MLIQKKAYYLFCQNFNQLLQKSQSMKKSLLLLFILTCQFSFYAQAPTESAWYTFKSYQKNIAGYPFILCGNISGNSGEAHARYTGSKNSQGIITKSYNTNYPSNSAAVQWRLEFFVSTNNEMYCRLINRANNKYLTMENGGHTSFTSDKNDAGCLWHVIYNGGYVKIYHLTMNGNTPVENRKNYVLVNDYYGKSELKINYTEDVAKSDGRCVTYYCCQDYGRSATSWILTKTDDFFTPDDVKNKAIREANKVNLRNVFNTGRVQINNADLDATFASSQVTDDFAQYVLGTGVSNGTIQVSSNHLYKAVEKNLYHTANYLIKAGVRPSNSHLALAVSKRHSSLVSLLSQNKAPATVNDLRYALTGMNNVTVANLMIQNGARPDVNFLNEIIDRANTQHVEFLLRYVTPNSTSIEKAAITNKNVIFEPVSRKYTGTGGYNNAALTAIKNTNSLILKGCLAKGANPNTIIQKSVAADYEKGVFIGVQNGGNANEALDYYITKNDQPKFTELLLTYHANSNLALQKALAQDKRPFVLISLKYGANPASLLKQVADNNQPHYVKDFVNHGANPTLVLSTMVGHNDVETVRFLIAKGAAVNNNNDLITAVKLGNLEMTKLLVESGLSASNGLQTAYDKRHLEIFTYLLSKGASPQQYMADASKNGLKDYVYSMLQYGGNATLGIQPAVYNNQEDVAMLLLVNGAATSGLIKEAAKRKQMRVVKHLLQKGESPRLALEGAVQNDYAEMTLHILQYKPNVSGLIQYPAGFGQAEVVRQMLLLGANAQEGIWAATQKNRTNTIKVLLDAGAKVNSHIYLDKSLEFNNTKVTNWFITSGSDVTFKNTAGETYLQIATNKKNKELVSAFINTHKIDVNHKDSKGNTAIYNATQLNSTAIIKLLLDAGAQVKEHKYLDKALAHKNSEVVKLFIQHGSDVTYINGKGRTYLHRATLLKKSDILEAFIKTGKINIDLVSSKGFTALQLAVWNNLSKCVAKLLEGKAKCYDHWYLDNALKHDNLDMVKMLIKYGGNISFIDKEGNTYVHRMAKLYQHQMFLKTFTDLNKINLEIKNNAGNTALMECVQVKVQGKKLSMIASVKVLVEAGADVNTKDAKGKILYKRAKGKEVKDYLKSKNARKN